MGDERTMFLLSLYYLPVISLLSPYYLPTISLLSPDYGSTQLRACKQLRTKKMHIHAIYLRESSICAFFSYLTVFERLFS